MYKKEVIFCGVGVIVYNATLKNISVILLKVALNAITLVNFVKKTFWNDAYLEQNFRKSQN